MPAAAARNAENDRALRLIAAYREKGDRRAIERLVSMNAGILNSIVRRYASSSGEPCEDLRQVGYVGLMKAVNGYSLDSAAKFSSYAYAMIEGELRHHLRDTPLMRKPRWAKSLYARVSEARNRLTAELGRPPRVDEIAREVKVAPEGIHELMKLYHDTSVSSLDEPRDGEEGTDFSAIKNVQYESFSLPVEDRIWLEQSLESLTELQQKALYLFFYKDLSQTEIGRKLGLPQRKVSRLVASALKAISKRADDYEGRTAYGPAA